VEHDWQDPLAVPGQTLIVAELDGLTVSVPRPHLRRLRTAACKNHPRPRLPVNAVIVVVCGGITEKSVNVCWAQSVRHRRSSHGDCSLPADERRAGIAFAVHNAGARTAGGPARSLCCRRSPGWTGALAAAFHTANAGHRRPRSPTTSTATARRATSRRSAAAEPPARCPDDPDPAVDAELTTVTAAG
jgi:hypothetical protein